ncbi:MAG: MBL fold metallo-hydrolase, partial [Sphingobium sp.]
MQTIRLGDMTIDRIVETDVALPMSALFPAIESADLAKLSQWYWDDDLSLDVAEAGCGLSMHSYLLRIAGKIVLIDTCNGNHKDRPMPFMHRLNTPWLDRLRAHGVEPEDVDLVMCTHLHVDHVGWNTRLEGDRWVPTFPNARYVLGKRDLDFFSQPGSDDL